MLLQVTNYLKFIKIGYVVIGPQTYKLKYIRIKKKLDVCGLGDSIQDSFVYTVLEIEYDWNNITGKC